MPVKLRHIFEYTASKMDALSGNFRHSMVMLEQYYWDAILIGPEVWRQGWRQFFLVCSQATLTSLLEQSIAAGSARLSGVGVMECVCTLDVSGWMSYPNMEFLFQMGLFYVSMSFFVILIDVLIGDN